MKKEILKRWQNFNVFRKIGIIFLIILSIFVTFSENFINVNYLLLILLFLILFINKKSWKTILGKIGETSISLFYYKYPLLEKTTNFEGIQIVGMKDLSAMKINAIEDRGTRRDFIDLFFLTKKYSVDEMLNFYDNKYGVLEEHLYSIIRALNYFDDAEKEVAMPKMLVDVSWDEVKSFFTKESIRLAKLKLNV